MENVSRIILVLITMDKRLYDKFPQWSKEKQEGHYMLGTDDLDSQATQSILNQVFGYEQNMYATRNGIYMIDNNINKHIGVDLALLNGFKTYDNHVTLLDNKSIVNNNSANINSILKINTKDNYFKKCAFSTLLQVMSLLNVPLPKTDEGKMFLLSIDSSHFGHYNKNFKQVHNTYLELLGFTELIDICNKYSKDSISNMRKGEYLTFQNGILSYNEYYKKHAEQHLGYELYFPKEKFQNIANCDTIRTNVSNIDNSTLNKNVFSCAFTGKNQVSYTNIQKLKL